MTWSMTNILELYQNKPDAKIMNIALTSIFDDSQTDACILAWLHSYYLFCNKKQIIYDSVFYYHLPFTSVLINKFIMSL